MKEIVFRSNVEGFAGEIKVTNKVVEQVKSFLQTDNGINVIKDELHEIIDRYYDEDVQDYELRELTIAVEDDMDANTYDSITFNMTLNLDDENNISGMVIKK